MARVSWSGVATKAGLPQGTPRATKPCCGRSHELCHTNLEGAAENERTGHASVSRNIAQCLQHGLAADVIKSANPVHRQDGGIKAGLRRNQQSMGGGFGADAGGEGKLKKLTRIQEPICKVLPQEVTNHDPLNIRLLKGHHPPQTKSCRDAWAKVEAARTNKALAVSSSKTSFFFGPPQVAKGSGSRYDRGRRFKFQNRRIAGHLRLVGSAGGVLQLREGSWRKRSQRARN